MKGLRDLILPNFSNLVFQMVLKTSKCDPNNVKMAIFFLKNTKNCPLTSVCNTLELLQITQHAVYMKHFSNKNILIFGPSSPLAKSWLRAWLGTLILIRHIMMSSFFTLFSIVTKKGIMW